jgi:CheY-like chemotaxis protein
MLKVIIGDIIVFEMGCFGMKNLIRDEHMKNAKLPCFYYPTTVVIVDDNQIFLDNLPSNLSTESFYTLFDSPTEALKFLLGQRNDFLTQEDFFETSDDLSTGIALNINIPKIHMQLYDAKRFKVPSVIIVDHEMPEMNGIEFCRRLSDYPIKKIMLTGVADHKLAIQAFNDGIIHKFILKDDPNVFEAIDEAVHALQHDYFVSLSELIIKNITTTTFSLLEDKVFQEYIFDFVKKNKICEFYLTSATGSFLFLNNSGELIWFVVQSKEQIENYTEVAKDHEAPLDIIQALTNREKLLCLFSEEDYKQPVEKWESYLYPADKIEGLNDIYYSIIAKDNSSISTSISKEKLVSYVSQLNVI